MTTVNVALRTRVRVSARAAASGYCTPTPSGTFFPVAPGTTLPTAPSPTTNVAPLPPNAATAPEGWDPRNPDLCWLFQDILPVSAEPLYPTELTVTAVAPPYVETVVLDARVRTGLGISTYPYDLTPVVVAIALPVRPRLTAAPSVLVAAGTPAAVTVTTNAPTIAIGAAVAPPAATITTTAPAPTIGANVLITPPPASITVTTNAPIINALVINVPTATITVTTRIPTINRPNYFRSWAAQNAVYNPQPLDEWWAT